MVDKKALTGSNARRERGRQEMRAAIVKSAGKIVARDGSDGLTIRAVAQDLGYSPGALYEYFDSKELILCALYFEGTDGLGAHCEQAVSALPDNVATIDKLKAIGRAYRQFALENPELYRLVFSSFDSPPDSSEITKAEDHQGGYGTLVRIVSEGIANGSFTDMPSSLMAGAAWASVHGFVALEIGGFITGGDGPGMPAPPSDEARIRRDYAFEAMLRMLQQGVTREGASHP